jgi:surfeit locus 1 family protein
MFSLLRFSALKRQPMPLRQRRTWVLRRYAHTEENVPPGTSYKARRDSWLSPAILLLGFMPIFTFTLGTWQLQRLQWKVNLIDELQEKLEREPIALPGQVKCDSSLFYILRVLIEMHSLSVIPDFIFRKVLLRGKWDHRHTMLVGPRVREGQHGYHVVTPLIRSDGSTVLVNRGFVSKEAVDKGLLRQETEEVDVFGMLRTSQVRNAFTPDNHPEKGQWYWADVATMSEFAGGERAGVQPVLVEEVFGECKTYLFRAGNRCFGFRRRLCGRSRSTVITGNPSWTGSVGRCAECASVVCAYMVRNMSV